MSKAMVRPMPNPPSFGARASTAVPKTAKTRKNVRTVSMKIPVPAVVPLASPGVPRCTFSQTVAGKIDFRKKPAIAPPTSWETISCATCCHCLMRPVA